AFGESAYQRVVELASALRQRVPGRLLGICAGTPGIVDDEGTVVYAAHMQWTNLPLAERIAAAFGVPAVAGNDMNVAALGAVSVRWVDVRDLIGVQVDRGVGMGVVVGRRVVEGQHFAAGEMGHITVDDNGERCRCGRRGCLEAFILAALGAQASGG